MLLREARFKGDEEAGMTHVEIMENMRNIESMHATPSEIAAFLYSKQNYRVKYNQNFIEVARAQKAALTSAAAA